MMATGSSSGNAKHQAAAAAALERVQVLRADIRRQLQVLVDLDAQLGDLADTRQSVGLGFMTPETRELLDKQTRDDRAAVRGAGRITTTGLGWLNANQISSTARGEAPVTIAAVSVSAEILFALRQHVARLAKPAMQRATEADMLAIAHRVELEFVEEQRGYCVWPQTDTALEIRTARQHPLTLDPPVTDGDTTALADDLARLVDHYANRPGLEALLRDLDHLEARARDVVDGPARTNHPGNCPWCGRRSLVIHHREKGRDSQVIRCEGRHVCACDWQWCDCHRNPVKNRHEWVNSGRATHTWNELSNLQNARKELLAMETRALDALEQIKALHQPFWIDSDGNARHHYVLVDGDQLAEVAPGHECVTDGPDACATHDNPNGTHPEWESHSIPACVECQQTTGDGTDGFPIWPCRTYQAADLDQQPDVDAVDDTASTTGVSG